MPKPEKLDARKSERLRTKQKILLSVLVAGRKGISPKSVVKNTGYHLDTVSTIAKELEREKKIRIKRHGQWPTYYASSDSLNDAFLQSSIIARDIFGRLQRLQVMGSSDEVVFGLNDEPEGFRTINHSPFVKVTFKDDDWLEALLYQLSVKLGIVMLYLAVMSMGRPTGPLAITDSSWNSVAKDKLVKDWYSLVISGSRILWEIKRAIPYGPDYISDHPTEEESKAYHERPFFELNEIATAQIKEAFGKLFPSVYEQFSKIEREIPEKLETWKIEIKRHNCKHEFGSPKFVKNQKMSTCKRCGFVDIKNTRRIG